MTTISLPLRHVMQIQTRDLAHFMAFTSKSPKVYRTAGEQLLRVQVIGHAPGTGGDGPGPDLTFVEVEVPDTNDLFYLAHYWGQRELRLRQLEGAFDNVLSAWGKKLDMPTLGLAVMWAEGLRASLLTDQICTIEQSKELVALGCSAEGPCLAWWREYGHHIPEVVAGTRPLQQFAQVAKWHAIEQVRKQVPDHFFPAWTAAELWAMFPKVSGTGPTWYAGPSRNGGWYCKQTNGKDFQASTQAQAVAAMLIYLLKNKIKFYPVQEGGEAHGV